MQTRTPPERTDSARKRARAEARLWAFRMRRFTARDLDCVMGEHATPALARIASEGCLRGDGSIYAWDLTGALPDFDVLPERQLQGRHLVARTLAFAEFARDRVERDPAAHPGLRRFALHCLGGLLLPCGPIDDLSAPPIATRTALRDAMLGNRSVPEMDARSRQRIERARVVADGYRTRAQEAQEALVTAAPGSGALPRALSFARPPKPDWPALPRSAADLGSSTDALWSRFGPIGQMLAGSKSRMIWSSRVVFNGQLCLEGSTEPFWHGDLWLFPPEAALRVPGMPYVHAPDPRPGALDVARAYGRPVTARTEQGSAVWTVHPNGRMGLAERGRTLALYAGERLEASGWPLRGDWPVYPAERSVPAWRGL